MRRPLQRRASQKDAVVIRRAAYNGKSFIEVGNEFGVGDTTVSFIVDRLGGYKNDPIADFDRTGTRRPKKTGFARNRVRSEDRHVAIGADAAPERDVSERVVAFQVA